MIVEAVAPVSVAATAGIQVGDVLHSVDDEAASRAPIDGFWATDDHTYTFYSPARNEECRLQTSGVPLGMKLSRTDEAIVATFQAGAGDFGDLIVLWERENWSALEQAARLDLERDGPANGLDAFTVSEEPQRPSVLMRGVAQFEQGDHENGYRQIYDFHNDSGRFWTLDFNAVAHYYFALNADQGRERQAAVDILREAHSAHASERIARKLEEWTGSRPGAQLPTRRRFPVDYRLRQLVPDAGRSVQLGSKLRGLGPDQLFIVCALAHYRGNGPYCEFLFNYMRYARAFMDWITGLHVITMKPDREGDPSDWYGAEDEALRIGAPFAVLHDTDGEVTEAIEPTHSPYVCYLDRDAEVVHTGHLDEVGIWNLLAGSNAPIR